MINPELPVAHIDFETRGSVDLRKTGAHRYAEHKDTDVWCMAYALGDDTVYLWPDDDPQDLFDHIRNGGEVMAHNAAFEYVIWNYIMAARYGWPELPIDQVTCTMAMAFSLSLPGSLDKAAKAVGLDTEKDDEGRRLMMQMARPRRTEEDGTIIWWDDASRKHRLYEYCKQDVEVERQLEKKLLRLPETEQTLWQVDQIINGRGVYIDTDRVEAAIASVESEQKRLNKEIKDLTGGEVTTCGQVQRLLEWTKNNGAGHITTLAKHELNYHLQHDELPDKIVRALHLRQEAAKASTAKLKAMRQSVCGDNRARGLFQYHGAGTGRWSGRRIQLQNIPRPEIEQDEIEWAIQRVDDPELVKTIYGSLMQTVSDCLRGMIRAAPGYDLLGGDFAQIEARVLAWLADEQDALDVFYRGDDIYAHAATQIYGYACSKKTTPDERQIGKTAVLALGYGGGVGAFQSMASNHGVYVQDDKAEEIKRAWRDAHPMIVQYWKDLENAAKGAVRNKGEKFQAGPANRSCVFLCAGSFLFCKLPSGRCLSYPYPKMIEKGFYRTEDDRVQPCSADKARKLEKEEWDAWVSDAVGYKGNDIAGKWTGQDTYGGKLAENVTQAVARDILAEAIMRLEAAGYPVVLHVHDEVVCEVPQEMGHSVAELEQIMEERPDWAKDMPVVARGEGWRGTRYRK